MANIQEYLAKSGYKPDMKDKSLNIYLDLWLYIKNKIQRFGDFYFSFSLLTIETPTRSLHFRIFHLKIHFQGEFRQ
jgi:hypothetical protein